MYNDTENPFDDYNRSNDTYSPKGSFWETTRYWASFSAWQWGGKLRNATYSLRTFLAQISQLFSPGAVVVSQTLTPAQVSLLPETSAQEAHSLFLQVQTDRFNKTGKANCAIDENGQVKNEADTMANGGLPPWKRIKTKFYVLLWVLIAAFTFYMVKKQTRKNKK